MEVKMEWGYMGCKPNNTEINVDPSFYTNGLDTLQKREKPGNEHRNVQFASLIFSGATESPLHHTF